MATLHPYLGVSKEDGYHTRVANTYQKQYHKRYVIVVNKKYDKDIIKWMEENKPHSKTIKRLIR